MLRIIFEEKEGRSLSESEKKTYLKYWQLWIEIRYKLDSSKVSLIGYA